MNFHKLCTSTYYDIKYIQTMVLICHDFDVGDCAQREGYTPPAYLRGFFNRSPHIKKICKAKMIITPTKYL